tara:strand:+ start:465 stop:593 length:129 start_codon:yes stop_codon:yes gene_type:complete
MDKSGKLRTAPNASPLVKAFVEMAAESARLARVKQQNVAATQ